MSLKKKLLCLVLCSVIVTSLGVTAWAETGEGSITSINGTKQILVTGYYEAGGTNVYSVELSWGSMEFKYIDSAGDWNPITHRYDNNPTTVGWQLASGDQNDSKITVTNHSNVPIQADFSAVPIEQDISTSFTSNGTLYIDSAVGTEIHEAPSGHVFVSLNGELGEHCNVLTDISRITVMISNPTNANE